MYNRVMAGQPHHGKHGGDGTCHGPNCFRWTFLMVAALCCVATAFAAALWYRSRAAYQQVIKVGTRRWRGRLCADRQLWLVQAMHAATELVNQGMLPSGYSSRRWHISFLPSQVMMAERMKRGIKAEMEEAREILVRGQPSLT